jgi:hypothetical protein
MQTEIHFGGRFVLRLSHADSSAKKSSFMPGLYSRKARAGTNRSGTSEHVTIQRRRTDALALVAEESVRSYPSWIAELSRESSNGIDRGRYAYEYLGPGEALELVRERTDSKSDHAVSYYHRAVHLGYVPRQHHWIAAALDDGFRFAVIVEKIKRGWIARRRAKSVGTRIIILYDGR